jgi:hypothetical protein
VIFVVWFEVWIVSLERTNERVDEGDDAHVKEALHSPSIIDVSQDCGSASNVPDMSGANPMH